MNSVTPTQATYLLLSAMGAMGTWYFNLQVEPLSQFFQLIWQTPLSSSLGIDLLVVVGTFFLFMVKESRRVGIRRTAVALLMVLTFLVAVAFTLPFFLFLRERRLMESQ